MAFEHSYNGFAITISEYIDASGMKFTVRNEKRVVGRAFLYILENDLHKEPFGFLEDVFVEEAYRGKGLGKKLIEVVIEEAKTRGCYKLIGNSRFENEPAHGFYEKIGFKKHGYEFRMDFK